MSLENAQALSGLEVSGLGRGRSLRFHALVRSSSKHQGPLSAAPRLCAVTVTPRRLPAVEQEQQAKPSLLTTLVRRLHISFFFSIALSGLVQLPG